MFRIVLLFIFFFGIHTTLAQQPFTLDSLKVLNEKQGELNVYFAALWCLPCVKHLKHVSDSLEKITGFRGNNFIIFDRLNFKRETLSRIDLRGFDSTNIFLIPRKYYSNSFIQINPSNKVLSRFLKDLEQTFPVAKNGVKFWFDSMFKVTPSGGIEYFAAGR